MKMIFENSLQNLPARDFRAMKAQPIVAWTLPRLARAIGAWLMEEDHYGPIVAAKANPVSTRQSG